MYSETNDQQLQNMRINLAALRFAHQWSIEQLSERSKIPAKTLRAVEISGDIRLDELQTLCTIYHISLRGVFETLLFPKTE